jgi:hypothetical protein
MSNVKFPQALRLNNRIFFLRSELEKYKRALVAAATGDEPEPVASSGAEVFVPAEQAAREFGFSRRTLGRRIRGFDKAKPAEVA